MFNVFKDIPLKLRISTAIYNVLLKKDVRLHTKECYGVTDTHLKTISLTTKYPDYPMVEIFLHEILHALFKEYMLLGSITGEEEESVVTALAKGLINLFIDNPMVLEYIKNRLDEQKAELKKCVV